MDQAALAACLAACLHQDPPTRQHAEQQLGQAARQAGFAPALLRVLSSAQDEGLRQLGAVVLKQYVKEHWHESGRRFTPPACSEEEKALMRAWLPPLLGDPSSRVRTAISMAIAAVADFDFPLHWPGLLEWLVAAVKASSSNTSLGAWVMRHACACACSMQHAACGVRPRPRAPARRAAGRTRGSNHGGAGSSSWLLLLPPICLPG